MARDGLAAGLEGLDQFADRPGRARPPVGSTVVGVVPGFVDAREDPLGPTHVVGIDGGEGAAIVKTEPQPVQLPAHVGDVLLGGDPWMLAGLDRILLGGQAEGIVAHGVQDVLALHPVVAADHVGGDVTQGVTHMQALARRIGEHVDDEVGTAAPSMIPLGIRQVALGVGGPEGALLVPALLPVLLDGLSHGGIVAELRLIGFLGLLMIPVFIRVHMVNYRHSHGHGRADVQHPSSLREPCSVVAGVQGAGGGIDGEAD